MDQDRRTSMDRAVRGLQELITTDDFIGELQDKWKAKFKCTLRHVEISVPGSLSRLFPNPLLDPLPTGERIDSGGSSGADVGLQDELMVLDVPSGSETSHEAIRVSDGTSLLDLLRDEAKLMESDDSFPSSGLAHTGAATSALSSQGHQSGASLLHPFLHPDKLPDSSEDQSEDPQYSFVRLSPSEKLIDLSFLHSLKTKDERFFPKSIYVRKSMHVISDLFSRDAKNHAPREKSAAFLGSPGVGKSILMFLAALNLSHRDITTFYRKTSNKAGENVSVFVMFPCQGSDRVNVLFTRGSGLENVNSLFEVNQYVAEELNIEREDYWAFVDGPHHADEMNTLKWKYDYFCTSGGFPPFRSDESDWCRMWILDAWRKEEALDALTTLGHDKDTADRAYWLCGGSIRDMISACSTEGYKDRKLLIDDAISFFSSEDVQLAERSSVVRERSGVGRDRLRRMFRDFDCKNDSKMKIVQLVDSKYALMMLHQHITLDRFFAAYGIGLALDGRAMQGLFFECIIHRWFEIAKPDPIKRVCWSVGTTEECVAQLVEPCVYWVPGVCNFPAIDSAVIIDTILHVLQITIRSDHRFSFKAFEKSFVKPVTERFTEVDAVVVYLVVPKDTDEFDFTSCPIYKAVSKRNEPAQKASMEMRSKRLRELDVHVWLSYECECCSVDMSSEKSIRASLQTLPFLSGTATSSQERDPVDLISRLAFYSDFS
jgi:hypothetical protein